jgi:hypothetical protein
LIKTNSGTLIAYCKVPSVAASWMAQLQIMLLYWVIFMEYWSHVKLWCANSSFFFSAEDHHIKACRITAIASTWTWQLQIGGVQCFKVTVSKPARSLQLPVHELGNSKLEVCNASRSLYQSLQDHCNCQYMNLATPNWRCAMLQGHCIKARRITAIASTWTWQLQIGGVQCSRSLYQSLQDYCNCTAKGNFLCLLVDCTWGSSKAWWELGCKMSQMANLTYNERKKALKWKEETLTKS